MIKLGLLRAEEKGAECEGALQHARGLFFRNLRINLAILMDNAIVM